MVHKRSHKNIRQTHAAHPSPKMTIEEAQALLASTDITGYDKALLLGLMTEFTEYAKTFARLRGKPKLTIFGSARLNKGHPEHEFAKDFANHMAQTYNYDIITGAGPGIMEAGSHGAGKKHAIGLNISLPFEQEANPYIEDDRLVTFYYFLIRKLAFVRESDAIVLSPGGFGTLDEAGEALTLIQTGRAMPVPIVMLEKDDSENSFWKPFIKAVDKMVEVGTISATDKQLYYYTNSIEDAADYINNFYYHYHSMRILEDGRTCIRLNREVDQTHVQTLFEKYNDLFVSDEITYLPQGLDEEKDEPDVYDMPRMVFAMDFTKPTQLAFFIHELKCCDFKAKTAEEAHKNKRPRRVKITPEDV